MVDRYYYSKKTHLPLCVAHQVSAIRVSAGWFACLLAWLFVWLFVCLFVSLFLWFLFLCFCVSLFLCLVVCLLACLLVCLFVCFLVLLKVKPNRWCGGFLCSINLDLVWVRAMWFDVLMILGSSVQSLGCRFFGHVFLVYVLPEGGTLTIISKDHGNLYVYMLSLSSRWMWSSQSFAILKSLNNAYNVLAIGESSAHFPAV